MPANVRRFFQAEEPYVSPRQSESAQDGLEREARVGFGGWCDLLWLIRFDANLPFRFFFPFWLGCFLPYASPIWLV